MRAKYSNKPERKIARGAYVPVRDGDAQQASVRRACRLRMAWESGMIRTRTLCIYWVGGRILQKKNSNKQT